MDLRPDATRCYLVSDLHGNAHKYQLLFELLNRDPPDVLFMAGDLLPPAGVYSRALNLAGQDFVARYLLVRFESLRRTLAARFPLVLMILGNDDARFEEPSIVSGATTHAWHYLHLRRVVVGGRTVFGYSCIPPSPFRRKDWERYDVSRYVDPGCISPEEGELTVPMSARERRYTTIAREVQHMVDAVEPAVVEQAVFLFHVPPYDTALDTADLVDQRVNGVPVDPHIGSIAVRRMIETRRPYLTLHGHVHEAVRLSGSYATQLGPTWCLSSAHDGPELAVIEFQLDDPGSARRLLLG